MTDSRAPGEPKQVEGSALYQIYQAFASEPESAALRQAYADGIAWADAKQMLFERIEREIAPMRASYDALMADPGKIEDILLAGAVKARKLSAPFAARLRHAVGLRNLRSQADAKPEKASKAALPIFKQYREADGKFYFKLADAHGRVLLQSLGFDSPKDVGQTIRLLQSDGALALAGLGSQVLRPDGVTPDDVASALAQIQTT